MTKRIILFLFISILLLSNQTEAAIGQSNHNDLVDAVRQVLNTQTRTSPSNDMPAVIEKKKAEKPDLTQAKALTEEIGDVRTKMYTDFRRHYVHDKEGTVRFNAPKGLYAKYKDMLVNHDGTDFKETLSNFYEGMQQSCSDVDKLLQKLGPELVHCLKATDKNKLSRQKITKLLGDWFVVNEELTKVDTEISFNDFIERVERLDLLLETSRQIFMAVTRHFEPPVRRNPRFVS